MAKKVEIEKNIWRVLIGPPLDGYLNMAADELLLEEAQKGLRPPTLRFYQWAGDWISFGYFQTPEKAFNVQAAKEAGVAAVRRLTGGRAVLHSEDLTYAVVAGDAQKEGLGSSLKETYRQIAHALASGFTRLGLPVALSFRERKAPVPSGGGPAACFLSLSDYELSFQGKKLVGSAQRREGSSFLQHGSIPLTVRNRELAERVLARSVDTTSTGNGGGSPDFRSRYATVEEAAGKKIPAEELADVLKTGFEKVFDVGLDEEKLSPAQWGAARELARKYATPEWNERKRSAAGAQFPEAVLG